MKTYFWIAINGGSCAASGLCPLPPSLTVKPTPQQLIGFETRAEQVEAQRIIITSPIEDVKTYMATLAERCAKGEIVSLRPENPDPPTRGQTIWIAQPNS